MGRRLTGRKSIGVGIVSFVIDDVLPLLLGPHSDVAVSMSPGVYIYLPTSHILIILLVVFTYRNQYTPVASSTFIFENNIISRNG